MDNAMKSEISNVNVVIGAGLIGQAIARRVSAGKHVLLADLRRENADAAAKILSDAGFEVSTAIADVSSRKSVHALVGTAMAIGTITADKLLALPMLQPDQVTDPLHAYQVSKRGNSLRVMAEAVRWGKRGARVNTIGPGIICTPLTKEELAGPLGPGYRRMLDLSPAGRTALRMRSGPLALF
jgi:NAD(P)-dependent dehydrogenase (short-subunit alcohol dehydrogenase family)